MSRQTAIDKINAWFRNLGAPFLGPIVGELLLAFAKTYFAGWKLNTRHGDLGIFVDTDFPFSKIRVHLIENIPTTNPHVEARGRLCLTNAEIPTDPVKAVEVAIANALELLRDIALGKLTEDYAEDFNRYWASHSDSKFKGAYFLKGSSIPATYSTCVMLHGNPYVFNSGGKARQWLRHRFGEFRFKLKKTCSINLISLPSPSKYPDNDIDLQKLIFERSTNGADQLSEALKQFDLPWKFHPVAFRASGSCKPVWAG